MDLARMSHKVLGINASNGLQGGSPVNPYVELMYTQFKDWTFDEKSLWE